MRQPVPKDAYNDMTRKRTSENDLVVSGAGATAPVRRRAAARPRGKRAAEPLQAALAVAPETVVPEANATSSVYNPTYEEIAALAYSYWEARGCQGGSADEDWRRAEQELRARANAIVL